jgi:Arc/MetJ-type ribon-helix-helix transcriptional regulator
MAKKKRQPAISFTPHPKVLRHIDTLLSSGLYGRSRSELVKRLVSEGIVARVGHPTFKLRKA